MKVKIKGLVFVGFAAAILSANAMATDANTVTSKSYVDSKVVQTIRDGENYRATAPSEDAVHDALALKQDIQIGATGTNQDPSSDANKVLIVGNDGKITMGTATTGSYQTISNDDYQIAMDNGAWYTLSNGTYTTVSKDDSTDTVKVDVAVMGAASASAGGTVGLVPASQAGDQDKVLQADGTWVAKQDEQTATTKYPVSLNKAWVDASGAVTVPSSGSYLERTPSTTDGSVQLNIDSNKINNTGAAVANATSANDSLVTDYTLAGAISNAMGGLTIPEKSSLCSAYPCALVAQSDGLHWYTMATSTHDGGAVGDYCTTDTDCAGGPTGFTTCTSGACGA